MRAFLFAIATAAFCALVYWAYGGNFERGDGFGGLVLLGSIYSVMGFVAGYFLDKAAAERRAKWADRAEGEE